MTSVFPPRVQSDVALPVHIYYTPYVKRHMRTKETHNDVIIAPHGLGELQLSCKVNLHFV